MTVKSFFYFDRFVHTLVHTFENLTQPLQKTPLRTGDAQNNSFRLTPTFWYAISRHNDIRVSMYIPS